MCRPSVHQVHGFAIAHAPSDPTTTCHVYQHALLVQLLEQSLRVVIDLAVRWIVLPYAAAEHKKTAVPNTCDAMITFLRRYKVLSVDYACHLGGLLSGLMLGSLQSGSSALSHWLPSHLHVGDVLYGMLIASCDIFICFIVFQFGKMLWTMATWLWKLVTWLWKLAMFPCRWCVEIN